MVSARRRKARATKHARANKVKKVAEKKSDDNENKAAQLDNEEGKQNGNTADSDKDDSGMPASTTEIKSLAEQNGENDEHQAEKSTLTSWKHVNTNKAGKRSFIRRPYVWIDLEEASLYRAQKHQDSRTNNAFRCQMTGLDHLNDTIIEIYCLITDFELNLLDEEGWGVVVHTSEKQLAKMGPWCQRTFKASGLLGRTRKSTVTPQEAASNLLAYIKKHVPEPALGVLAGNTIHMDRLFLIQEPYRPVIDYLHYQIFDLSSVQLAAQSWCSKLVVQGEPAKKRLHGAESDIRESLAQARYYRQNVFMTATKETEKVTVDPQAEVDMNGWLDVGVWMG